MILERLCFYNVVFLVFLGNTDVSVHVMQLEEGIIALSLAGRYHLVAVYGNRDAQVGMVLAKLQAVCSYFSRTFEQLYS